MADYVNPYRSALAPYFPKHEYKQDPSKVTHYLIYLNQERPLDQWIHPDPTKTLQTNVTERVNALVTDKKLHPLHLCAMLNQEKMAQMLLETKVCQIDPQDYLGFTPLHHAAVNNFKNIIALFIKYGANQTLTNSRQGTYLEVLNLVHPSIDPLKQMFYYKDTKTGDIVQGNGLDFQQYTGAETFLDKEYVISVNEAVKEWDTNPSLKQERSAMIPVLQKAYRQFREHPPLVYLEKREGVGINVCAKDDTESGTIIAEYLGEINVSKVDINPYTYEHIDGGKKRGIGPLLNDGFPNCSTLPLHNTRGVVSRVLICANTRIPKGSSYTFHYNTVHGIKFQCHQELNGEAMSAFFKKYTNESPTALIKDYEIACKSVKTMTEKNANASTLAPLERLVYFASTPHAMIKLVCDQTISFEALQPFHQALSSYYTEYPTKKQCMLVLFISLEFFSENLKKMEKEKAQKCREKVLENLTKLDVNGLINLLQSFGQT